MLRACHRHVALPSARAYESFNVAAAGSILMYDRRAKQLQRSDDAAARGGAGAKKGAQQRATKSTNQITND